MAGNSDHCAPLPRIQKTPCSTARVSCQGRPRLSSRRDGRKTGSTNSHCSSVSSQRPAMPACRDALSNFSLAEIGPRIVYEMGSSLYCPAFDPERGFNCGEFSALTTNAVISLKCKSVLLDFANLISFFASSIFL